MDLILQINTCPDDYIIGFERSTITKDMVAFLRHLSVESPEGCRLGLNLCNIDSVCHEFFEFLKETTENKKISLVEIPVQINALMHLMNYDKYAFSYINEIDFKESKRTLVKRNFRFCSI